MAIAVNNETDFNRIGSWQEYPAGSGQMWTQDADYELTADIDLSIISNYSPKYIYGGSVDGKGHKVKNLTKALSGTWVGAVFGQINGVIRNIIFDNITTTSTGSYPTGHGAICGQLGGSIVNCSIINSSLGNTGTYAGGFVSQMQNGSLIYGCTIKDCVIAMGGTAQTGAFTGLGSGAMVVNCIVANCTFDGSTVFGQGTQYYNSYVQEGMGAVLGGQLGQYNDGTVLPPDKVSGFKSSAAMRPTLADAKAGNSIYNLEGGFADLGYINGWDFETDWTITPGQNDGLPINLFAPYVNRFVSLTLYVQLPGYYSTEIIWVETGTVIPMPIPSIPEELELDVVGWHDNNVLVDFNQPITHAMILQLITKPTPPPSPEPPPIPSDFDRRMELLKLRPITSGLDQDYLDSKLSEATERWHAETKRRVDLGAEVDSVIVRCAVAYINQEGGEGMASVSEGGMSRTLSMDDIVGEMRKRRVFAGMDL